MITNSFGKELDFSIYGNWKFVPTQNWNDTRFVRMRIDTDDGSYMGPKYRLGVFTGVKRVPETKQFEEFKSNVLSNLKLKAFDKPIYEVLLNSIKA